MEGLAALVAAAAADPVALFGLVTVLVAAFSAGVEAAAAAAAAAAAVSVAWTAAAAAVGWRSAQQWKAPPKACWCGGAGANQPGSHGAYSEDEAEAMPSPPPAALPPSVPTPPSGAGARSGVCARGRAAAAAAATAALGGDPGLCCAASGVPTPSASPSAAAAAVIIGGGCCSVTDDEACSRPSAQRRRSGGAARPPRGVMPSGADQRYCGWSVGRSRTMTPSVVSASGTGVVWSEGERTEQRREQR